MCSYFCCRDCVLCESEAQKLPLFGAQIRTNALLFTNACITLCKLIDDLFLRFLNGFPDTIDTMSKQKQDKNVYPNCE